MTIVNTTNYSNKNMIAIFFNNKIDNYFYKYLNNVSNKFSDEEIVNCLEDNKKNYNENFNVHNYDNMYNELNFSKINMIMYAIILYLIFEILFFIYRFM
jgi:hypothetical protein